jgi:hypothetical protein
LGTALAPFGVWSLQHFSFLNREEAFIRFATLVIKIEKAFE